MVRDDPSGAREKDVPARLRNRAPTAYFDLSTAKVGVLMPKCGVASGRGAAPRAPGSDTVRATARGGPGRARPGAGRDPPRPVAIPVRARGADGARTRDRREASPGAAGPGPGHRGRAGAEHGGA